MTIWLVIEDDYDCTQIQAAYATSELAEKHALVKGFRVEEVEVLSKLPPEAVNSPENKRTREEARQAEIKDAEAYVKEIEDSFNWGRTFNPAEYSGSFPLCHCQVFSERVYNLYGYCIYCGGVEPEIFRQLKGEAALQEEISKLAEHDRIRMQDIVKR